MTPEDTMPQAIQPRTLILCALKTFGPIRGLVTFHCVTWLSALLMRPHVSWFLSENVISTSKVHALPGGGVFVPFLGSINHSMLRGYSITMKRLGTDPDGVPRIAYIVSANEITDGQIAESPENTALALDHLTLLRPLVAAGHGPVAAAATIMFRSEEQAGPDDENTSEEWVREQEIEYIGVFTREDVESAITSLKSVGMIS